MLEVVREIQQQLIDEEGDEEAVVRMRASTPQQAGAVRGLVRMVRRAQQEMENGGQP